MNRRGIYYPNRPLTEAKQPKPVSKSRVLLICGCVVCGVGTITAILALTLPYWVYFSETMETTVAGLTDPTEVKVFYGLLKYCLMMKATHLDIDRCDDRTTGDLLGKLVIMETLTQLAFFRNLQRAVIGPSATLTGR